MGRALAVGCALVVIAIIVSDQVGLTVGDVRRDYCFGPQDPGSTMVGHIVIAAPFAMIFAANVISLRQPPAGAFIAFDAIASVLSLLYLFGVSADWSQMPDAGDCANDVWGDYGLLTFFAQLLVIWPFATIHLGCACLLWAFNRSH